MIRPEVVHLRHALSCRTAAVLVVFSALTIGCTEAGPDRPSPSPVTSPSTSLASSPSPVSSADARDRLFALGDMWFRREATVTYRTTMPVAGQPVTAHLCLRQQFEDDFGAKKRAELFRRCSRQGSLLLVWDPPNGWRMDVITPIDRFTLTSDRDATRICQFGDLHACRGIPTADAIERAGADVFLQPPQQILHEIGATEVTAIGSPDDAVVPVECFAASGPDRHVEWCYTADGTLVSFLRGPSDKGWTSFEAIDIS